MQGTAAPTDLALRALYIPRDARRTVLYQAVQRGLPEVLRACAEADAPLPRFVERELSGFLGCGILEHGFMRVHCPSCGFDRLVPFSCKGRGFCPSCMGRQMADTATHLVDRVLPDVAWRQWVLTLPHPLRYLVAYDRALLAGVLEAFVRSVFQALRHRAQALLGLDRVGQAQPGAVTVIQRAGSAIDLNVHFHTLVTDGVFVLPSGAGVAKDGPAPPSEPEFRALPAPDADEIEGVAHATMLRTVKLLRRRGMWTDEGAGGIVTSDEDTPAALTPAVAACARASVSGTLALGPRAGKRVVRLIGVAATDGDRARAQDARAPRTYGFNLHAGRHVARHDRKGLERLLCYMLRPPLANERVTWEDDERQRVHVRLKRAWSDGSSHLVLTPAELVEKLVPLVPPPWQNRVRYHGVFAPNAGLRKTVAPPPPAAEACEHGEERTAARTAASRATWASLLARTFSVDALECPRCKARMQQIAVITQPDVIRAILASVARATGPPVAFATEDVIGVVADQGCA